MATAFSGSTMERNTGISTKNDVAMTAGMTHGRRDPGRWVDVGSGETGDV